MGSVERRVLATKVSYRATYRTPDGKQRSRSFDRKRDAERFITEVEGSKLGGAFVDPATARITVGQLADQWLAGKVDLKPTTRALYDSVIEVHIRPAWGSVPVGKVGHSDVQAWVAELSATGLSGGHVQKIMGVLSQILTNAVRDRRLATNPASGLSLPRVRSVERRFLTADQVEALASAAGEAGSLVVLTLSYCGLRWSELAGLRVQRLDLMRRRLEVAETMTEINGGLLAWGTPKSHEARSVPLASFLIDLLAVQIVGKSPDDLVFTTLLGKPLRNRNARRSWFDRAARAIGEDGLTPHELRHTAASLAIASGATVKDVQRMLGHASAALTLDRYAGLFEDALDDVAIRLDSTRRIAVAKLLPDATIIDLQSARK